MMSFQKRHRPCGNCDCRDEPCAGEFPQTTPVCCSECADGKSPCQYVAHFGCNIRNAEGTVCLARAHELLMPKCEFQDAPECVWYGLGYGYDCDSDIFSMAITAANPYWVTNTAVGLETLGFGCTWERTRAYGEGDFPLLVLPETNVFGWGWELHLADGGATFFKGDNLYSVETWVCDGDNTLTKVSGDDRLPNKVCITPWWFGNNVLTLNYEFGFNPQSDEFWAWKCPCSEGCTGTAIMESHYSAELQITSWVVRTSSCSAGCYGQEPLIAPDVDLYGPGTAGYEVECGCSTNWKHWILNECDLKMPCGYDSLAVRCACGDDCCDCYDGFIEACDDIVFGNYCIGGRDGVDSPSGQSREMCATYAWGGGDEIELCAVVYCSGGTWKVDGYVDGVFVATVDATATRCPFGFEYDMPWGIDCPNLVETDCCPDDPIPATLTAEIASSCTILNGGTVTLAYNSGTSKWEGSFTTTYAFNVTFWCFEDTWYGSIEGVDTPASCSISGSVAVGDCAAPLDVTFDPMSTECMPLDDCTLGQVNSTTMVVTA